MEVRVDGGTVVMTLDLEKKPRPKLKPRPKTAIGVECVSEKPKIVEVGVKVPEKAVVRE